MRRARITGIGFAGLALLLALGAVAWACTPSAYLYPVSPSTGAAGTEVTIRGGQFGNGPVELRWGTERGRLLGSTLGPDFTKKVIIPDKAPGVYYIVAVARDPADSSRILARRVEAFQITAGARSDVDRNDALWSAPTQSAPGEGRSFTALIAATGVGLAAAGVGLFTLALVRRRRATAR